MLTISPTASAAISTVLSAANVPEGSGLRISRGDATPQGVSLELTLADRPQPEDEVLETGAGAGVFVDPEAAELVDDQVLDADFDAERVTFELRPQSLNGGGPA